MKLKSLKGGTLVLVPLADGTLAKGRILVRSRSSRFTRDELNQYAVQIEDDNKEHQGFVIYARESEIQAPQENTVRESKIQAPQESVYCHDESTRSMPW